MSKKQIHILNLYPNDMNIYGDHGNVLVLQKRLEWRGFEPVLVNYNQGDKFPEQVDIVIGGGGQDSGQNKIQKDLHKIAPKLHALAQNNTPMLMICGLYQLFGRFFKTMDGELIEGIGIFAAETHAGPERLIGNVTVETAEFGKIVGYENHSGQTFLDSSLRPLGKVIMGAGNNSVSGFEGARFKNVIGSYLHGPILPKNPISADWIIETAIKNRYGKTKLKALDHSLSTMARKYALKRPR